MEPQASLLYSQVPAICPCPKPTLSSPHNPLQLPEDVSFNTNIFKCEFYSFVNPQMQYVLNRIFKTGVLWDMASCSFVGVTSVHNTAPQTRTP
jgi:hypothetical protein